MNEDEKVIKLTVDNQEFENKIKQSSASLENFTKLITKTAVESTIGPGVQNFFGALGNALGNGIFYRSLGSVSSGLEEVQMKFTSLGVIGKRILENLTDSAIGFARNGINALFLGIKNGGLARASNIEKAKFQIEGLGIAWKEVAEDINYGVESTAYGLDAAAMAASQLAASGVKFGGTYKEGAQDISEMGQALRAISGVAAMTSSSYEDISRIFTTVASNGRVMGDQLLQMSSRGLNAASELAKYFNNVSSGAVDATDDVKKAINELTNGLDVSEADIRDFVSKGKINFAMFSQAMDSAFGEHAKDANKTLEGSLSNVRAAMSKIGALFFQPLIAQESPLVHIVNTFREKLNEFRNQVTPIIESVTNFINKMFSIIADLISAFNFNIPALKVIDVLYSMVLSIFNIANNLVVVFKILGAAFSSVFPQDIVTIIKSTVSSLLDFLQTFKISSDVLRNFYGIFRGIFGVFNIFVDLLKSVYTIISPLTPQLKELTMLFLELAAGVGNSIAKFSETHKLSNLLNNSITNFGRIGDAIQRVKNILNDLIEFISNFGKKKDGALTSGIVDENSVNKSISLLDRLKMVFNSFKENLSNVKQFAGSFVNEIKKYVPVIDSIKNVVTESYNQIKKVLSTESGGRALEGLLIDGGFIGVLITGYGLLKKEIYDIEKEGLGKNFIDKLLGKDFMKDIAKKSKSLDTLLKKASDVLNSTKLAINQFQKNLQLDGIMKVAKALAILAGSLLVLSFINPDRLFGVLVTVSALFIALNLTIKQFDKLSLESAANIAIVNSSLVSFAAAILILSFSLGMISKNISKNGLGTSLFGLLELLVMVKAMLEVYKGMAKISPSDMSKSKSMLTTFSISMLILAGVLKILSTLDYAKGLFALLSLRILMENMVEVFRRISIINNKEGQVKKASKVFLAFSLSMVILGAAMKIMSTNTFIGGALSLIAFKLILEDMIAVIHRLSQINKVSGGIGKSSAVVLILSSALVVIATAVKKVSSMGVEELFATLGLLALMLEEFVRIVGLFKEIDTKNIAKAVGAMTGMSLVVGILSYSLKIMSLAEINDALTVFGIISGLLFEITAIISWFNGIQIDEKSMSAFAVAMSILTGMIGSFAGAIKAASEVDDVKKIERVVEGMITIGASTAILMALMAAISKMNVDPTIMFGIAGSMIALSTAMLFMAVALATIAEPIERINKVGFKGLWLFAGALTVMIGSLALLGAASQLGVEFLGFVYAGVIALYLMGKAVEVVNNGYAILLDSISNMINAWANLIDIFLKFKNVGEAGLNNIIMAMVSISGAMNIVAANMATSAVTFVTSFISGLIAAFGTINPLNIILNLILPIISSIEIAVLKEMYRIIRELAPIALQTLNVILEALDIWMPSLLEKIYNIWKTVMQFLTDNVHEYADIAVVYVITFVDAFMNALANHMPQIGNLIVSYFNVFQLSIIKMVATLGLNVIGYIIQAGVGIIGAIVSILTSIKNKITEVANSILDQFTFLPNEMIAIGKDVLGGLITGLTDGSLLGKILSTAYNIGTWVVDKMRDALDSHSDSEETIAVGNDTGHGLITGLVQQIPGINKISNFIGKIIPEGISEGVIDGSSAVDDSADVVNNILNGMADNAEYNSNRAKIATSDALKAAQEAANHEKYINSIRAKGGIAAHEMDKELNRQTKSYTENSKSANEASKSNNSFSTAAGGAGKAAGGAAKDVDSLTESFKSMEEMQSSLQEKISGSIDIFSEFSRESDLSADKLLANMRSQVEGVRDWSNNLQKLGARGIEKGLLQKLAELGPQGWDKVQAFVQMTDDQLSEANNLYAESLMLPQSESEKITQSFAQAGMWATDGFVNGIYTNAGYQPGMLMGQSALNGLMTALDAHSPSEATKKIGGYATEGFEDGLEPGINKVYAIGINMGKMLVKGLNSALGKAMMTSIGRSVVISFANSFTKATVVTTSVKTFCDNIKLTMEKGLLDVGYIEMAHTMMTNIITGYQTGMTEFLAEIDLQNKTLSDKMLETFTEIGEYAGEGLRLGIENKVQEVADETIKLCNEVIKKARTTFDENSPSRVFESIGNFIPLGLAKGISRGSSKAIDATSTMADSTIKNFESALNKVKDYIQNGTDDDLTITPVMDLSNIDSGLKRINTAFGSRKLNISSTLDNASRIAAAFNAAGSGINSSQNGMIQNNYTFNQTNTSPKALNNAEIYRQTKNLISSYTNA